MRIADVYGDILKLIDEAEVDHGSEANELDEFREVVVQLKNDAEAMASHMSSAQGRLF